MKFLFGSNDDEVAADANDPAVQEDRDMQDFDDLLDNQGVKDPIETREDAEFEERHRQLGTLRERSEMIHDHFVNISRLIAESDNSVNALAAFVDQTEANLESERRLRKDNLQLSKNYQETLAEADSLKTVLNKKDAELRTLSDKNEKYRQALEKGRIGIIGLREKIEQYEKELDSKNRELFNLSRKSEETMMQLAKLRDDYGIMEEDHGRLSLQADEYAKRESELQYIINENKERMEEQGRQAQLHASELEAAKRQLAEKTNYLVAIESDLSNAKQEIDSLKRSREDDQRKYDNRVFSLQSEVGNLTSDRKVLRSTVDELKNDNVRLKKSMRESEQKLKSALSEMEKMKKAQKEDRQQNIGLNDKLGDLNLRYNSALNDLGHEQRQVESLKSQLKQAHEENEALADYKNQNEILEKQLADQKALIAEYQFVLEHSRTGDRSAAKKADAGYGDGHSTDGQDAGAQDEPKTIQ